MNPIKLSNDKYDKEWVERRRVAEEERENLRARLASKHRLKRDKKFAHAFGIAWDLGHGSGLAEVENYFEDLSVLISPETLPLNLHDKLVAESVNETKPKTN